MRQINAHVGEGSYIRVRPEPGVTATVLESGHLELYSEPTGIRFRCSPVGAAMWIAIRQHAGDVDAAADQLAALWGIDAVNMRADLDLWVGELRDAGLVRGEP